MDPNDQHIFVMTAVENDDVPAFRRLLMYSPKKVMRQFGGGRNLEGRDPASGRVDTREDIADAAVLTACIHALEDDEQRVRVGSKQEFLQVAKFGGKPLKLLFSLILAEIVWSPGRQAVQMNGASWFNRSRIHTSSLALSRLAPAQE